MKTYFKICLLSPVWLPFVLGGICLLMFSLFGEQAEIVQILQGICFLTGAALVFGGIQYLIAMIIVWRRIDFEQFGSILAGCFLLPVIFTPIQLLPFGFFGLLKRGGLDSLLGLAGLDLMFGYAYVLLWFLGYWLFALFQKLRGREVSYG